MEFETNGWSRRRLLATLGLVAAACVGGVVLRRRFQQIMGTEDEDTLVVGGPELALARTLPVIWDPSESGAPALFDPSGRRLVNLDMATYRTVVRTAEVLLDEGQLAPGRYEYDDPIKGEPDEFKPFLARHSAQIANGKVAIDVTDQHLLLLENANVRLRDDGGRDIFVGIDSKRPYGDMTNFYIDMGAILGIAPQGPPLEDRPTQREFTDDQQRAFDALHEQMQPVVQAFLLNATLAPGTFARDPPGYGPMRRVK